MIGFTVGNWTILPQTVKVKGEEIEVPVKACRWTPIEDKKTNDTHFIRGRYWSYMVLLGDAKKNVVQIKLCVDSEPILDYDNLGADRKPKKIGQLPDTYTGIKLVFPKLAENKPLWFDPVFEKEKKKAKNKPKSAAQDGRELFFACLDNGEAELITRYGEGMANVIMCLLLDAFNETSAAA